MELLSKVGIAVVTSSETKAGTSSGCKGSQTRRREERVNRGGLFAWAGTRMVKGKEL